MADVFRCPCGFETSRPSAEAAVELCPACGRPLGRAEVDPDANTHDFGGHKVGVGEPEGESEHLPPLIEEPTRRRRKAKPQPPPPIPGYIILEELGRGGMGVVYRARQVTLNRVVALKMILAGAHATPLERERFRKEAEAVASLQHPGIVQIFEIGEHAGQPYLALEYVDGGSLAEHLATGDLMPVDAAVRLLIEVALSVHFAHELGVVHRDLKPANVLLHGGRADERGSGDSGSGSGPRSGLLSVPRPKVTDFGLAKRLDETAGGVTRSGAVMGTPSYISPEQASGKSGEVRPVSDVYALGAILYELLTGRPPFKGATPLETVLQVLNDDPVPPGRLRNKLPRDLETICLKCLRKDAAKRYPTAAELADDLNRFLDGKAITARPLSAASRGLKWARRHPATTAFGLTAVLALFAVVAVLAVSYAQVRQAVREKDAEAEAATVAKVNADLERVRAEKHREEAQEFARELGDALDDAEGKAEELRTQNERNERNLYALTLTRVASLVERDPAQARKLLDEGCPPHLRDFTWRHLRGLCHRDDQVYDRHAERVLAVAVSPDGSLVATADASGFVRLWSPVTKVTYAILAGHAGWVNGVAFAPDGATVGTTGDDGTVRLWDLPDAFLALVRESARVFPQSQAEWVPKLPLDLATARVFRASVELRAFGHRGRCVAFGPDGATLVAGGSDKALAGGGQPDGAVKVWDLSGRTVSEPLGAAAGGALPHLRYDRARGTGTKGVRLVRTLTDHLRPVVAVAVSPDGTTLATGSEDQSAQLTTLADGKSVILTLHPEAVSAVAFAPDGKTLATVWNGEDPVVVLWALTSRGPRERGRLNGHTKHIYALAFADGQTVASAGFDGGIRLWDPDSGHEKCRLIGHPQPIRGLAFLPDRRQLVSVSNDRTARVWQAGVRRSDVAALDAEGLTAITAAAVSRSGRVLVTAQKSESGAVRVWRLDAVAGGPAKPGQAGLPLALSGSAAGTTGTVRAVAVSDSGQYVAAAGDDGLLVWDTTSGTTVFGSAAKVLTPTRLVKGQTVFALALAPDGYTLAAASDDGVTLWDIRTGTRLGDKPVVAGKGVRALAFAPPQWGDRGRSLLAVGQGTTVRLRNLNNGQAADIPNAHTAQVESLAFAPGGGTLATGGEGGAIHVWAVTADAAGLHFAAQSTPVGHPEPVTHLAFTTDGRTLLSCGRDRMMMAWDPVTGQERGTFAGHTDRLVTAAVLPRDSAVVTVGRDGAVRKWKADPRPPRIGRGPQAQPGA